MDDKQHTSSSDDERAEIATSNQDQQTNSSKRVHLTLAIHINFNWYNPNNSCHHSCCIYFYKSKNKWFKQN